MAGDPDSIPRRSSNCTVAESALRQIIDNLLPVCIYVAMQLSGMLKALACELDENLTGWARNDLANFCVICAPSLSEKQAS